MEEEGSSSEVVLRRILKSQQGDGTYRDVHRLRFNGIQIHRNTTRGIQGYEETFGIRMESLAGKRVLDVGFGDGVFVKQCSNIGVDVTGVEPNIPMLRVDRRVTWLKEDAANKVLGINEALSFKSNSFDIIFSSFAAFYYLPDNYPEERARRDAAREMVKEMARVSKPGGKILCRLSYPDGLKRLMDDTLVEASRGGSSISWSYPGENVLSIKKRLEKT